MARSRALILLVVAAHRAGCGDNAFEPGGGTEESDRSGTVARGLTLEIKGDVFAATVSGDVDITTSGIAEAAAVSGSIDTVIDEADWGRDLTFAAVSGNVTVSAPSNTSAYVTATSVSGTVTSDIPLAGTARNRVGEIGGGGPRLTLTAVSGGIRLHGGPAS